ncbi:MAG: M48 family metalloprotease [Rhodocyclaceae bacterium]|nr:M48 family metalloprotease [Rhodocyclaceae bacterium]
MIVLAGCASAPESGRSQFAPTSLAPVSAAYSEMEMATRLAFSDDRACKAADCEGHFAFRRRVAAVAARLERSALALYKDLPGGLPKFHTRVVMKDEAGSLSSAMGTVVVLDGLRVREADDAALALVIAREMGHVIGRHHEENSATGLVISVLVQLLLPVANLVRGTAAAIQGGTAAVATTAASLAGTKAVLATYRPEQLKEADAIAFRLLAQAGWNAGELAEGGRALAARLGDEAWAADLRAAVGRFDAILAGPPPESEAGLRMAVALTPPGE